MTGSRKKKPDEDLDIADVTGQLNAVPSPVDKKERLIKPTLMTNSCGTQTTLIETRVTSETNDQIGEAINKTFLYRHKVTTNSIFELNRDFVLSILVIGISKMKSIIFNNIFELRMKVHFWTVL